MPSDLFNNNDESTFKGRNSEIFNNPPQEIKIPGGFFPHANFQDALWITMQARELKGISTGGRGGNLTLGKTKTKFKFLAPEQIMEMHSHDWNEYASIGSRMLEKIKELQTMTEQASDLWKNLKGSGITLEQIKKALFAGTISGLLNSAGNVAAGINVSVPQRKIDTPLIYSTSPRRQLQFEFVLADNARGREIVQCVKLMQSFAAASSTNAINIDFPHIWKVMSEPEGLLLMEHAAMTSIQPTWSYPFVDGYPVRANLTVSFTDMSPLFQRTITDGTIINVNPSENDLTPSNDVKKKGSFDPRNNRS